MQDMRVRRGMLLDYLYYCHVRSQKDMWFAPEWSSYSYCSHNGNKFFYTNVG